MALESSHENSATARETLTVSLLNRAVAGLLSRSFPLVRVRGEIANFMRAASGHWYLTLKDDAAQVRCVMFRGRNALVDFAPRDGDAVEVLAQVGLYEPRGEYQLTLESMRRAGAGRLFEEFLRLKARLAAEGLFDAARKRALPRFPRAIGVVTSLQAAALRDVVTTLARRAPHLRVVVYPVPVQGAGAGERIAAMLDIASRRAEVDALLLVRGGGSIEDLWAFNEESVARAIRACRVPVIVGVGHESDFTIADFAADLRAPTPTAAAELVAPERDALLVALEERVAALRRRLVAAFERAEQRLDYAQRALGAPRAPLRGLELRVFESRTRLAGGAARIVETRRQRLADALRRLAQMTPAPLRAAQRVQAIVGRLTAAATARVHADRMRLARLEARLHALDPLAVLARGYSVVHDASGRVVRDGRTLARGERLDIRFAEGGARARVEDSY
ncbi:MAG: exodeoxyribonuclease VII large subunit [Burkholderiaceae bacterium]|nr:exodeoxyribonuclease VII large subunit [Burkholderiaceae bacterium]